RKRARPPTRGARSRDAVHAERTERLRVSARTERRAVPAAVPVPDTGPERRPAVPPTARGIRFGLADARRPGLRRALQRDILPVQATLVQRPFPRGGADLPASAGDLSRAGERDAHERSNRIRIPPHPESFSFAAEPEGDRPEMRRESGTLHSPLRGTLQR